MRNQLNLKLSHIRSIYGYLFITPAFILIFIFYLYPIFSGLLISFLEWNGVQDKLFVGLSNYTAVLQDKNFHTSFKNTLFFVLGTVPATICIALIFAALLNVGIKGVTFFRAVYFLPTVTSGVAIAVIWRWLYNSESGLLNSMLYMLGLPMLDWLNSSRYALLAIIIMSIWKSLGLSIVILLAGLQSIPRQLYEAASIDGANVLRKFWSITIPMLSPILFFLSIISIIGSFQVFEEVLVMTEGGPGNATLVIVFYIYREAFENFNLGYASALSYILFVAIMAATLIQWAARKYWVHSETE